MKNRYWMKIKVAEAVGLVFVLLLVGNIRSAEPLPKPAQMLPSEIGAVLQVPRAGELVDRLAGAKVWDQILAIPQVKEAWQRPQARQFRAVVAYVETMLDTDWRTGLRTLLGGGLTIAAGPKGQIVMIADCTDEKLLKDFVDLITKFAEDAAQKAGRPDRVKKAKYQGVPVVSLGPNEYHAVLGRRLVVANGGDILKAVLDLYTSQSGSTLAQAKWYQQARQAVSREAAATLFVNFSALKKTPNFERRLQQARNPLSVLLAAPLLDSLEKTDWLAAELSIEQNTVRLTASAAAPDSNQPAFARFEAADGAWPNITVPGRIAAFTTYRDLRQFYARKDELFPERTSGLIFFENMMGIFFSGRNLTDEVLAELQPQIRLVAATQRFQPGAGRPEPELPALAAVFRMRHPDHFRLVVEEAWQKALGLINFTRGQRGEPGLIIDRTTYKGVKYTLAFFSDLDVNDRQHLDVRFNFRPCLAMFDDYLVLTSTEDLARDLIDALKQERAEGAKPLAGVDTLLEVDGRQVACVLEANRDALVRQNMVKKGTTREQAEREVGWLLALLEQFPTVSLSLKRSDQVLQLTLAAQVDLQPQKLLQLQSARGDASSSTAEAK